MHFATTYKVTLLVREQMRRGRVSVAEEHEAVITVISIEERVAQ